MEMTGSSLLASAGFTVTLFILFLAVAPARFIAAEFQRIENDAVKIKPLIVFKNKG